MHADNARWRRVTELFHAALERPERERRAFLSAACDDDAALVAEVESLLASHARASPGGFIESPAVLNDPDLVADAGGRGSLAGRTLGHYRIEREIARGGMGVVYLAEDTRLARVVALKALPIDLEQDDERRERFRREAQAAAKLAHPSVAAVYALEEIDGSLVIASEYIEGHSLRDEIRSGGIDQRAALDTARAIASALASLHALGIVHRDLKPENVMRATDGQVKVLDFGLAFLLRADADSSTTRLTRDGSVLGTPGYIAPEQFRREPIDARADIYSFGVLLHELLTGRLPSSSGSPPPSAPAIPPQIAAIVAKCVASDPAARFQTAGELMSSLEAADSPQPAGVARPTANRSESPHTPLWWWQFHQLAVAALHAALVVGLWSARGWLEPPWQSLAVFAGIGAATADVTMRLNLWFASRVHPAMLAAQRVRLGRAILIADVLYALVLCLLAAMGAGAHDELAVVLLGGAIVSVISLLVIEPATAKAAFSRSHRASRARRQSAR
jgi:eukaryotic-like serine/threonine-protein kinase